MEPMRDDRRASTKKMPELTAFSYSYSATGGTRTRLGPPIEYEYRFTEYEYRFTEYEYVFATASTYVSRSRQEGCWYPHGAENFTIG